MEPFFLPGDVGEVRDLGPFDFFADLDSGINYISGISALSISYERIIASFVYETREWFADYDFFLTLKSGSSVMLGDASSFYKLS